MTCTATLLLLESSTLPLGPTAAMSSVDTFCPAVNDIADVVGCGAPSAHAVRSPSALGLTAVTVSATAATFVPGSSPWPATGTATAD